MAQILDKNLIKIGTLFYSAGKHKRECKVIDILKTYNSANELVKTEYLEEHEFCGQKITSTVVATSVLMRLISY